LLSSGLTRNGSGSRRSGRGIETFWLYFIITVFFLGTELFGTGMPRQVRAIANDIVSPVLSLLEKPVRIAQAGLERLAGVSDIYLENEDLRAENDRLKQWRQAAMQLSRENETLRRILKVPKREIPPAATARIIGVGGGSFERSVLTNAGSSDGVVRDQPVVDENGLIGRVITVGRWTSRILLITDLNSRVPVRLERTGDLAIAVGQNETFLRLEYLEKGVRAEVGDRLLTSGHGGIFPADLPIARVSDIQGDYIFLEPVGLIGKLDNVRIMAYTSLPEPETGMQKLSIKTQLQSKSLTKDGND